MSSLFAGEKLIQVLFKMPVILPFSTTTVSKGLYLRVLAVCSGNFYVKQVFGGGRRRASRVASSVPC